MIPSKGVVIGILLVLSFAGTFLANERFSSNYYCHWQICDLMLYIALGDIFKDDIKRDRGGSVALILYCIFVVIGCLIWGCRKLPYVTYGFGTTVDGWLMHVMMAVSGSIAILWIARKLPHQAWLCYLGRQSLIVYMTQRASLLFLLSAFAIVLNNGAPSTSVMAVCAITIATCSIAAVIAHLIDNTPLRVIMGRSFKRKVNLL